MTAEQSRLCVVRLEGRRRADLGSAQQNLLHGRRCPAWSLRVATKQEVERLEFIAGEPLFTSEFAFAFQRFKTIDWKTQATVKFGTFREESFAMHFYDRSHGFPLVGFHAVNTTSRRERCLLVAWHGNTLPPATDRAVVSSSCNGPDGWIRTTARQGRNLLLCPLSYIGRGGATDARPLLDRWWQTWGARDVSDKGVQMATTKYDLLAALIEAQGKESVDELGWRYLLMGVVHRLGESYGSEEALSEELFNFLADATVREDEEPTEEVA